MSTEQNKGSPLPAEYWIESAKGDKREEFRKLFNNLTGTDILCLNQWYKVKNGKNDNYKNGDKPTDGLPVYTYDEWKSMLNGDSVQGIQDYSISGIKGKKVAIQCSTQQEWDQVTLVLGRNWASKTYWDAYKTDTCIRADKDEYCRSKYWIENGYQIISADQFLKSNGHTQDKREYQVGDYVTCKEGWTSDYGPVYGGSGYKADRTFRINRVSPNQNDDTVAWPEPSGCGIFIKALRPATESEIRIAGGVVEQRWIIGDRVERIAGNGRGMSQDIPVGTKGTIERLEVVTQKGKTVSINWDNGDRYNCLTSNLKHVEQVPSADIGWKHGSQFQHNGTGIVYTIVKEGRAWWVKWGISEKTSYEESTIDKHWNNAWTPLKTTSQVEPIVANIPVDSRCVGWQEGDEMQSEGAGIIYTLSKITGGDVRVIWPGSDGIEYSIRSVNDYIATDQWKIVKSRQVSNNQQSSISINQKQKPIVSYEHKEQCSSTERSASYLRTNPKVSQGSGNSGGKANTAICKVKPQISQE